MNIKTINIDEVLERHNKLVDERNRLKRMLVNLIDAHYGASVHHIGDGDGLTLEQAKELQEFWEQELHAKSQE